MLTAIAQFVVCLATAQALAFNFQLSKFYLITTSRMSQLITLVVISILPILRSSCNSDRLLKSFSLKPLITSGDSLASRVKKKNIQSQHMKFPEKDTQFQKGCCPEVLNSHATELTEVLEQLIWLSEQG